MSADAAALRVVVDREVCISAGLCVTRIPSVFDVDDDGVVQLLRAEVDRADDESAVREAADICPSGAITVDES